MSELIIEARAGEVRDLFRQFSEQHPDASSIEIGKANDGGTLLALVIENAPALSASTALLIAALRDRKVRFKLTKDGIDLGIGDADTPTS